MIGSVEDCGRSSNVDCISGRRVSIVSGSGMMGRGPENEAAREVKVRDWCVRWVVRASWAVLSLEYGQLSLRAYWMPGDLGLTS